MYQLGKLTETTNLQFGIFGQNKINTYNHISLINTKCKCNIWDIWPYCKVVTFGKCTPNEEDTFGTGKKTPNVVVHLG